MEVSELLKEKKVTIATAESCTGGLIAHKLTSVAGSSAYFVGSVVSYTNEIKKGVLGVSSYFIEEYTEVSGPVAISMAEGVRLLMHTDIGVSTTGIAGPTGELPGQPVGTVWIAVSSRSKCLVRQCHFDGNRQSVIESAAQMALEMVREIL